MIEVVDADRCIGCDRCIDVCPTRVFDRGADGIPVIARQTSCQTCFQCEAYCPTDALFVAPLLTPAEVGSRFLDLTELADSGLMQTERARASAVQHTTRAPSPGVAAFGSAEAPALDLEPVSQEVRASVEARFYATQPIFEIKAEG